MVSSIEGIVCLGVRGRKERLFIDHHELQMRGKTGELEFQGKECLASKECVLASLDGEKINKSRFEVGAEHERKTRGHSN